MVGVGPDTVNHAGFRVRPQNSFEGPESEGYDISQTLHTLTPFQPPQCSANIAVPDVSCLGIACIAQLRKTRPPPPWSKPASELGNGPVHTARGRKLDGPLVPSHRYRPTSQRPHFTGDGHTKPILNEVKDKVLLGLWTGRVVTPKTSA